EPMRDFDTALEDSRRTFLRMPEATCGHHRLDPMPVPGAAKNSTTDCTGLLCPGIPDRQESSHPEASYRTACFGCLLQMHRGRNEWGRLPDQERQNKVPNAGRSSP